jgi:hypothetical protein
VIFEGPGCLCRDARGWVFSEILPVKFKSLRQYLESLDEAVDLDELDVLVRVVEESLTSQAMMLSCMQYRRLELSGEWGHSGEGAIKEAFGRMVLGVGLDVAWSYAHQTQLETVLSERASEYGWQDLPVDLLKSRVNGFEFDILGERFGCSQYERINGLLKWIGSDLIYFSAQGSGGEYLFLGTGKRKQIGTYVIFLLDSEVVRHPSVIMALAAVTGNQTTVVRREALQSILYQKWVPVAEKQYMYRAMISGDIHWNISMGIKQYALHLYGVDSREELFHVKDAFITDLQDTVLHHELGHCVMEDMILTPEQVALGKGTECVKETIFASLLEFFADFAPQKQKFCGAMANMVGIAKKDKSRATRMFYMYLSDVWFYDTPDQYMYLYSDLMLLILMRYIQTDKGIDFDLMARDIDIDPMRNEVGKLTIMDRIYKEYVKDVLGVKKIIEKATYQLTEKKSYPHLKKVLMGIYRKAQPALDDTVSLFLNSYWMNMVGYVMKISDSAPKMTAYLDEIEVQMLKKVMVLSCGRKRAEAYGFDHRRYIMDRMIELGIVADAEAAKRFYKGPQKALGGGVASKKRV